MFADALSWNAVLQGVITGVVGAAVLGAFALIRFRVRDSVFRFKLWRQLGKCSSGWNTRGITYGIRNRLGKPLTIRSFVILTNRGNFRLSPTADVQSSSKEEDPQLTWWQLLKLRQKLKSGQEIPVGPPESYMVPLNWLSQPTIEGFVQMEPFTRRSFLLDYQLLQRNLDAELTGFTVTIEYEAWPERRKILHWTVTRNVEQLRLHFKETCERLQKELEAQHSNRPPPPINPNPQ